MRNFRTLAAIFTLLFFANLSWGQGTITYDSGYPTTVKGTYISVAGTISPDCGWSVSGSTAVVRVWQDGGVLLTGTASICGGVFSGSFGGLQSATTYNVTVEVTLVNGCDTVTIITDPGKVTTN